MFVNPVVPKVRTADLLGVHEPKTGGLKSLCHIQFDACTVCANNVIFAFVVVSFFCGKSGVGGSARQTNISKNH